MASKVDLKQFKGLDTAGIIAKMSENQKVAPVETKSETRIQKVAEPKLEDTVNIEDKLTIDEDTTSSMVNSDKNKKEDSQEVSTESKLDVESSEDSSETEEDSTPTINTIEKVSVLDDSGRREIEVDFSDREFLRKQVQLAHGARKWQAERDKTIEKLSSSQERLRKVEDNLKALDDAFQREGVEGVIDLLHGERGASKKWIAKHIERADFLKYATPDQARALEMQEQLELMKRERELDKKNNEEYKKSIEKEREEAAQKSLESIVEPSFMKYGFSGKLGNSEDEEMFNKMLYKTVMDNLESKEGDSVSAQEIEGEFKKVSETLSRRINAQADRKAMKIVDTKKKEATQSVQKTVRSTQSKDSALEKEVGDILKNRDYTKLFSGIRKYNSFFQK